VNRYRNVNENKNEIKNKENKESKETPQNSQEPDNQSVINSHSLTMNRAHSGLSKELKKSTTNVEFLMVEPTSNQIYENHIPQNIKNLDAEIKNKTPEEIESIKNDQQKTGLEKKSLLSKINIRNHLINSLKNSALGNVIESESFKDKLKDIVEFKTYGNFEDKYNNLLTSICELLNLNDHVLRQKNTI